MSVPTIDRPTSNGVEDGRERPAPRVVRPNEPRANRLRYAFAICSHLVSREFRVRYRRAVLGWVWSVGQPLLRFFVLLYVFTQIIVIGTPQYPQYLFSGLIAWAFFAGGISSATSSPMHRRELLFRPGLPRWTAPLTAVAIDGIDFLAAVPVLFVLLAFGDGVPLTATMLLPILLVQVLLILGIGMLTAIANVYFHDTRIVVDVVLSLGFYLTPVLYRLDSIHPVHRALVAWNPMTPLLDAQRRVLIDKVAPDWTTFGRITAIAVVVFVVGLVAYERASRTFVDQL